VVIVLIICGVIFALLVLRLVWRLRNDDVESGGSWGQQISGDKDDESN
jgi:hypothetical protein